MKNLFLFLCLFSLIACGKAPQEESGWDGFPLSFSLNPDPHTGVPYEASTFDTNIYLMNFDQDDEEKIMAAAELVKRVVASPDFKDAIINHTYGGEKTFVDNGGLTNEQIYQVILAGAERLNPRSNNAMDVKLQLYYEDTNVIGYTYPDSQYIWMNRKYFGYYTPNRVSGNLMHEWLHKLGFEHSSAWTESRRYSVPYAVGYLMERLASELY